MCSGAMLHARLARVVYGAPDAKTGAAGSVTDLFAQRELNHHTQVQGGVLAAEAAQQLQSFFKPRRVNTEPVREDALRTPDTCFEGLPGYPWQGFYTDALPALNGLRMHFLNVPADPSVPASGHTYLCLHGDSDWSYAFREQIPAWTRAGHRVVAPDLIGFGKSDKPKKDTFHTLEFHRRVLLELVEHLDLRNLVLVVSDRGAIRGLTLPIEEAQQRYLGLQVLQMAAASRQSSHAYDAPFPDGGHRAALRAFAKLRVSKEILIE